MDDTLQDGDIPGGLLAGHAEVVDRDGRLRVRPSADFSRLNFLRVMRSHPGTSLSDPGGLIGPPWPLIQPAEDPIAETGDVATDG